jgi:DNA repair photolyase
MLIWIKGVALYMRRFKTLTEQGIFPGILMMPVLPFIEDTEDNIQSIIELAYKSGARFIYSAFGVTLRQNQRDWYYKKLDELFPTIKDKYIKHFGNSYECRSPREKELFGLIKKKCNEYGILYKMNDIITEYKKPYQTEQLSLF